MAVLHFLLSNRWHLVIDSVLGSILLSTCLQAQILDTVSVPIPIPLVTPSNLLQSKKTILSAAAIFQMLVNQPLAQKENQMGTDSLIHCATALFHYSFSHATPLASTLNDNHPRVHIAKISRLGFGNKQLTLNEAVQFALRNNPEILDALQQIRLIHGKLISGNSQLLPCLSTMGAFKEIPFTFSATSETDTESSITQLPSRHRVANHLFWNVQFSVQQLVFDGGGSLAGSQAIRHQEEVSFFTLRSTIDSVVARVKMEFFRVILCRAIIEAQERSIALLEDQLEDQKSRYRMGTVPKINVLQAQVAVANALPTLIEARNKLHTTQYQLFKLLGMKYTDDHANIPFHVVGNLDVRFRTVSSEESIRLGLARNPALKAHQRYILSQAALVREALAHYYPKIRVSGGYIIQNNVNSPNLMGAVEGWFVGVNGTWDIFDGLNTSSKVTQAKAQLAQSKIRYDNSLRSTIASIHQSIADLQHARETIESQQASTTQAEEMLRLANERLKNGAGTQLEVLNAQVTLLQMHTSVLQARFGYVQALARYEEILSLHTQYNIVETLRKLLTHREQGHFKNLLLHE